MRIKRQLSSIIRRDHRRLKVVAVNRDGRSFTAQNRALFDLLSPHFTVAWQNTLRLSLLSKFHEYTSTAPTGSYCITVDSVSAKISDLSPPAAAVFRHYFGTDSHDHGRLPDDVRRWLLRASAGGGARSVIRATNLPEALVISRGDDRLIVRIAQFAGDDAVLLLEDQRSQFRPARAVATTLTRRETEILHWITEGKSNPGIAIILGISPRTVEKHVEHIFEKLGVETRIAAIRHVLDARNHRDG